MCERTDNWGGMNWIRKEKRLAIYLRDGLACSWCANGLEDGAKLCLDHILPVSKGGANEASNLVTACMTCNTRRGNRTAFEFSVAVSAYVDHGVLPSDILVNLDNQSKKDLAPFLALAKQLIKDRGGLSRVLAEKQPLTQS